MISIVILTHNQLPLTQQCLQSIRQHTRREYEIIVVDNASTDGSVEWLEQQPDVKLIQNKSNRGFPAGCNQGMKIAKGDYVLLLNNDTVVTSGWITRMMYPMELDRKIGLVGPLTNNISGIQRIQATYTVLSQLEAFADKVATNVVLPYTECNRLVGFCLLIRKKVIDEIGMLDEQYGMGNFEDDDFCERAMRAGWKLAIANHCYIHHVGSATFAEFGEAKNKLLGHNREIFIDKWSRRPGEPARTLKIFTRILAQSVAEQEAELKERWYGIDVDVDVRRKWPSRIDATNEGLKDADWDILIVADEEMHPTLDYDQILRGIWFKHFGDSTNFVLHQHLHGMDNSTATVFVVGREYFDRFGYVLHPSYGLAFAEREHTEVAEKKLCSVRIASKIITFDAPGEQREKDQKNYQRRKALGFPLETVPA